MSIGKHLCSGLLVLVFAAPRISIAGMSMVVRNVTVTAHRLLRDFSQQESEGPGDPLAGLARIPQVNAK